MPSATTTTLRSILTLCLMAACPLAAHADGTVVHGGSAARAHPTPRGGGPSLATRVQIDERFNREIGGGCQYLEAVSGTLETRASTQAAGGLLYAPDLRVEASVQCEHQPAMVLAPRTVRASGLDANAFETLVETRTTMHTPAHAGEVCTFTPDFVVQDGTLRGQSVARSCAARDPGAHDDRGLE